MQLHWHLATVAVSLPAKAERSLGWCRTVVTVGESQRDYDRDHTTVIKERDGPCAKVIVEEYGMSPIARESSKITIDSMAHLVGPALCLLKKQLWNDCSFGRFRRRLGAKHQGEQNG